MSLPSLWLIIIYVQSMSRTIPVPPKTAKKKMPPPPRPNLGMQLVEVNIEEAEQERPQKLLPPQQLTPSNPQPVIAVQAPALEQKEQKDSQTVIIPAIKKAPLKKPMAPAKAKKAIPRPTIIVEQNEVPAEQPPQELIDMTEQQLKPKEVEQPALMDAQIAQPVVKAAENVEKDEEIEAKPSAKEQVASKKEEEFIEIKTQSYKPPPAPPSKNAKKGKAPPPPTKPKSIPISPKQTPIYVQQQSIPQAPSIPQPPKPVEKPIQPLLQKDESKVQDKTAEIKLQVRPTPPPPSAAKNIKKQPQKTTISASGGKSSMSAKLQELRRAKQQMLNDESDEEQFQQEQQNYTTSDFVKEEPQPQFLPVKVQTTPIPLIIPEVKATKPELNITEPLIQKQQKTPIESEIQIPAKVNVVAPPKHAMRAPAAPGKRIIPPPTVKNMPKMAQSKLQNEPAEPKQIVEDVKPAKVQIEDAPKEIQVSTKEKHLSNQPKPNPIIVEQKVKVVKTNEKKQQSAELNALLQRYHSLKSGYISNLRQLDDLIHFQKQQEDNQIEKINHLLSELHRRNQSIKEICSIKELPPSEPEIAI